jgi:hypothetical protein
VCVKHFLCKCSDCSLLTEKEGGKKKEMITVEVKREIIWKHEQGMQVAAIARFY